MTIKSVLKESIFQIKCEVVGHAIVEGKEKPLFAEIMPANEIYTDCIRCGTPLVLTRDKKDGYFMISEVDYLYGGW